jgi:hypothetical protein
MLMEAGEWTVYGGGAVTAYRRDKIERFENGQRFVLG